MFFNQVESNIGYDLSTDVKENVKNELKCDIISSMQKRGQLHLHELSTFEFSCFSPLHPPAILNLL